MLFFFFILLLPSLVLAETILHTSDADFQFGNFSNSKAFLGTIQLKLQPSFPIWGKVSSEDLLGGSIVGFFENKLYFFSGSKLLYRTVSLDGALGSSTAFSSLPANGHWPAFLFNGRIYYTFRKNEFFESENVFKETSNLGSVNVTSLNDPILESTFLETDVVALGVSDSGEVYGLFSNSTGGCFVSKSLIGGLSKWQTVASMPANNCNSGSVAVIGSNALVVVDDFGCKGFGGKILSFGFNGKAPVENFSNSKVFAWNGKFYFIRDTFFALYSSDQANNWSDEKIPSNSGYCGAVGATAADKYAFISVNQGDMPTTGVYRGSIISDALFESGSFVSPVIDLVNTSLFASVRWNATVSGKSELKFFYRVGDPIAQLNESKWVESRGALVSSSYPNFSVFNASIGRLARFLQYKFDFVRVANNSPQIYDVWIDYFSLKPSNVFLEVNGVVSNVTLERKSFANAYAYLLYPHYGQLFLYFNGSLLKASDSPISASIQLNRTGVFNVTVLFKGNSEFMPFAKALFVTVRDSQPPPMVSNLVAKNVSASTIAWSWPIPDDEIKQYQVWLDEAWVANVSVNEFIAFNLAANNSYGVSIVPIDFGNNLGLASPQSFARTLPDFPPKFFEKISVNSTQAGSLALFSLQWADDLGLKGFSFSSNNSGEWETFSNPFSGTSNYSNFSIYLNNESESIAFYFTAFDTFGNSNSSEVQFLHLVKPQDASVNVAVAENFVVVKPEQQACTIIGMDCVVPIVIVVNLVLAIVAVYLFKSIVKPKV